ncbi:hypothetical protein NBO_74g0008 [Nosema bombycis CQ1]|uniref:Uncharacterized protein n=1 Tax=Nosema bombycis (strain CQ1 / CVCC 102059) TaxID=578461 RepID=R0MKX3_NOSB1|nr:hypothetical protein NBO_74g0008 [Nosema bombycis CQ1]|eukprot:EOB13433.1 hypothetical protein NBO_74g0008 [Nosema bombycis CQ1]
MEIGSICVYKVVCVCMYGSSLYRAGDVQGILVDLYNLIYIYILFTSLIFYCIKVKELIYSKFA